jgi:hypothetical protein
VNVTPDAKLLVVLKRIVPSKIFGILNYWMFSLVSRWGHHSKAKRERMSALRRLYLRRSMK